jgi:hypothetical protein
MEAHFLSHCQERDHHVGELQVEWWVKVVDLVGWRTGTAGGTGDARLGPDSDVLVCPARKSLKPMWEEGMQWPLVAYESHMKNFQAVTN